MSLRRQLFRFADGGKLCLVIFLNHYAGHYHTLDHPFLQIEGDCSLSAEFLEIAKKKHPLFNFL